MSKLLAFIIFGVSLAAEARYVEAITQSMGTSACAKYSWKDRGRAPAGYIKGMGLAFARSLCRTHLTPPNALAALMSKAAAGNAAKDALSHYQAKYTSAGIRTNVAGAEALRALYVLGMGLGMRESSGAYCEGWDTSAGSNRPATSAEAGLFQTSYDSIGASKYLKELYTEYKASPARCHLNVFKEGASCRAQTVLGSGVGAEFQKFNKSCPAFATEYAVTLLRILRAHFGPINRREAELNKSCNTALKNVQTLVEADAVNACAELF